jgi:hypothetical protein
MKLKPGDITKNLLAILIGFAALFVFVNNYKIYETHNHKIKPIWVKERYYGELAYKSGIDFLDCDFKVDFSDTALAGKDIKSIRVVTYINPKEYDITVPLVFAVKYMGKHVYWRMYELQKCLTDTGTWQRVELVVYPEGFKPLPGYEGAFYFWNKDNCDFSVQKLRVGFYTDSIPQPLCPY